MRKILSFVIAMCMLFSVCALPALAEEAVAISQMQEVDIITVTVDGKAVDCAFYGQLPVIVEGRTLVPLRSVFEALGATVEWNNDTRSVTSVKGNVTISLAVDSKDMTVNGEVKTLDVPAQIMNNRTMVPVRAVAEAFGCKVEWNNDTRTVVIATELEAETPEAVVKKAYDAMLALDIESAKAYYKNADDAMGEFAGANTVSDIIGMTATEDVTDEQVALIEKFTKDLMQLVTYEIIGSTVTENTAEVTVSTTTPNFESINMESYLTEEVMAAVYISVLTDMGYTIESIAAITDEAEIEKIANALTAGLFDYMVEALIRAAKDSEHIVTEEVQKLEKIDGKWLLVE